MFLNKVCRVCGCTDNNACITEVGPCWWVEEELCSACDNLEKIDMQTHRFITGAMGTGKESISKLLNYYHDMNGNSKDVSIVSNSESNILEPRKNKVVFGTAGKGKAFRVNKY